MAIEKRVTFNQHGDPRVVITIEGWSDVVRFGWAIQHLQCEFSALGRRMYDSLRRKVGTKRWREIEMHYTGRRTLAWRREAS